MRELSDIYKKRMRTERYAEKTIFAFVVFSGLLVFIIGLSLFCRSMPLFKDKPFYKLLLGTAWHPSTGDFGFLPFIAGTIWVTLTASAIAIPICLLCAIFLTEYAGSRVRAWISPLIDILAGIPSVVYGMWGVLVIVPFIRNYLSPGLGRTSSGYSVLAGGIVLAVMIFPVITHISVEVLRGVPAELRDASLALGATKWQTIKHVVLKRAMPGILAACVLGLSRAFGETIAVLMVVGNVARIPGSLFDPAYPLPALIANHYGEMLSIPRYDAALLFAAFILFLVVLYFNIAYRMILSGSKWSVYYDG